MTAKTKIMGIINATPDSFAQDGIAGSMETALKKAEVYMAAGVDIIDVGGESTRPSGSEPVSAEEEARRVLPVISAIRQRWNIPISIDTFKASVADQAIRAGATMINDVSGMMLDATMGSVAKEHQVPIVLMHSHYGTDQVDHQFSNHPGFNANIVEEVVQGLERLAVQAISKGLTRQQIIVDPGIGFGKNTQENLALIKGLDRIKSLGYPVLLGASRKSFIGRITQAPVEERLAGSLAMASIGAFKGADIIRVHDVVETIQAIQMIDALRGV